MENPKTKKGPVTRQILTVAEAARTLGLSRSFTYRSVREGRIPSIRLGERILVPIDVIQRLLRHVARPRRERRGHR